MAKIRQLAGETVLYGLGTMVPRFLAFLLFFIHTNIFSPAEYGVFTYLMAIVTFLNVIYSFGMETAFFRFASVPGADQNRVFNLALTIIIAISTPLSVIFILASDSLAATLGAPERSEFIIWLSLIIWIDNVAAIPFAKLRMEKRALQFTLFKVINVVITVGLNLFFLYAVFDPAFGIGYLFLANLIANAMYLAFFFRPLLRWRPAYDPAISPQMIRYSYPVMLTGLAAMTNQFFSVIMLERWLPENFYPGQSSSHAIGVFGASSRFAVLMNLIVQAFRMAAEPFFFAEAAEKNSRELFARVNHYFILTCCFVLLAVTINMDVLKHLINEAYWDGIGVVLPLSLGYLFLGVYYNLTVWYKLTDKTIYGTLITVGGALLTVVLNFIFIPIAGYLGSSWSTAAVYGVMMAVCYFLGQKHYPIPYLVGRGLVYMSSTVLIVLLVNSVSAGDIWLTIGLHALVLTFWALVVYLLERKKAGFRQPVL